MYMYVIALTAFVMIAYAPIVVSFTIIINGAIDAYHGGVAVAAAAATTGQRNRAVLAERMSPATMVILVLFWAVLGVVCYRYTGCYLMATGSADVRQQPQESDQSTATAKRKCTCPFRPVLILSCYNRAPLALYLKFFIG